MRSTATSILGPLFVAGARQVMKKALAEDKRDLERGAFVPGAAAGNVEGALDSLHALAGADAATKHAVLDAACLVSAVDGDVDSAERNALARLAKVLGSDGEAAYVDERLRALAAMASSDRIAAEADRIGAALRETGSAAYGVTAAAVVGLVSRGMSLGELEALRRMAGAAGFAEESLGPAIDAADAALSA